MRPALQEAAIGVAEYWRVDPTGGDIHPAVLEGERLYDGGWIPITVRVDDGARRGHSDSLDLDIVWNDELLFYQHRRNEPLPNLARSMAALRATESARLAAEADRLAEEKARQAVETARQEAEAAAAAQAAEIARLKELLRRHGSPEADPTPDPPG